MGKNNTVQNRNSPVIKKSVDFNFLSKNEKRKETRYPDDKNISDEDGDSVADGTDLFDLGPIAGGGTNQDDSDAEFSDDFINFDDGSSDEANDVNYNFAQSSNVKNEIDGNGDVENKVNIKLNDKALKKSKYDVTRDKKQPAIAQSKGNEMDSDIESSKIDSERKLNEDVPKMDNVPSKKATTELFVPPILQKKILNHTKPSSFVGFIKVPKGITVTQLKEALAEKVDSTKILEVILKFRNRRNSGFGSAFVYLADKEALETLISYEFIIGDTSLVVQEARQSEKKAKKKEPVSFIPRIPSSSFLGDVENKVNVKSNDKALKKCKNDVTKDEKQPAIAQSKANEMGKSMESSKIGSKRKLIEDVLKADNVPSKRVKTESFVPPNSFVGLISQVPKGIMVTQLKEALAEKVDSTKILEVILKFRKKRNAGFGNAFVYLADKEALETLIYYEFTIGDISLVVHQACEPPMRPENKEPVAFIRRLHWSITEETIKNVFEKDAGVGKVVKFEAMAISYKKVVRNLLVYFSDEESLSAVVSRGLYQIDGRPILVREAFESRAKSPLHRVLLSPIPQGTTEADIKTAVESVIGEDTVKDVKFSFQKNFAFVTLTERDYVNKALSTEIEINSQKLKFGVKRPRKPRKRPRKPKNGAKNKNTENTQNQSPANITKKQEAGKPVENQQPLKMVLIRQMDSKSHLKKHSREIYRIFKGEERKEIES